MSNLAPISCRCPKCRAMCSHSVCLPTPKEARELLRRGYALRMAVYQFKPGSDSDSYVGPATKGREDEVLNRTNYGACTFHKDGLCELHDLGLKPLEGRATHHDRDWREARLQVVKTWKGKAFESVSSQLNRLKGTAA